MMPDENSNIRVEITDASEFHCFRLVVKPRGQGPDLDRHLDQYHRAFVNYQMKRGASSEDAERRWSTQGYAQDLHAALEEAEIADPTPTIEVMLHARALVDLIHQCSTALCDWQKQTTEFLTEGLIGEKRISMEEWQRLRDFMRQSAQAELEDDGY